MRDKTEVIWKWKHANDATLAGKKRTGMSPFVSDVTEPYDSTFIQHRTEDLKNETTGSGKP